MIPLIIPALVSLPSEINYIYEQTQQTPMPVIALEKDYGEKNKESPKKLDKNLIEHEENSVSIPIEVESPPTKNTEETIPPIPSNANQLGKPISIEINKVKKIIPATENSLNSVSNQVKTTRLLTKSRKGEQREFNFQTEITQNNTESPLEENPVTIPIDESVDVVEIVADEQEYLDKEQIVKAKGNVVIRFSNGILSADEVKINLTDRIAVAQGAVILKRGDQTLRGYRFEYYFVKDQGIIFNANGEIYQPNIGRDLASQTGSNPIPKQPLSWQIQANQPLQRITTAQGYRFSVGSRDLSLIEQQGGIVNNTSGGEVNRLRFEADRVDFDSEGWHATDIRFTNDPFSPPEFEVRADTANLRNTAPFIDELTTTNSRLVFDQTLEVPLFQDRLIFDRRDRNPGLFNIGFDGEEKGGLYIERPFNIYQDEKIEFIIAPQFLIQRAFFPNSFDDENAINPDDNGGLTNPSSFGLISSLNVNFSNRTELINIIHFTSLDLDNIDNRLRANLQLNQKIGYLGAPHTLSFQYNYRERLFNGSLGFQTVQNSIGALIRSPYIPLGDSGLSLVYQGSIQNITADSDRQDLLKSNRSDNLVNLNRFQAAALLNAGFLLWYDEALPPTPEEGLKYTATPVTPYLKFNTSLTGVTSYYSSGDTQPSLTGTIGLEGQVGHFSNPFLDYTGFNVSYSQGLRGDQSPFYFDRFYDTQVLSLGLTQQLYGPVRGGIQTFLNVQTNKEISTDYFLEYSRRTYNIMLRYNPVLQLGSINLRISDFNWEGNPLPFEGTGIKPVIDGITR